MALEERLELDIAEALRGVDNIEDALTAATQAFKVGIAEALDLLSSVAIAEVDASVITSSIDAAVEAADLEPEIIADASGVTSSIDEAVGAAELEASISGNADEVTSSIEAAVGAADQVVEIEANTSAIPDAIATALGDVDASVEIGAITAGITEQIETAITDADTELEVSANTADAEASLDGLAEASGAAEEGLTGSAGAMGALGGASQLATGDLAGVGATLGAVSARGSAVAGVGLTLATAFGAFTRAALDSDQAQRRYNTALGEFADEVSNTRIPGFAANLEELAEKTGNSDEAMKAAAAAVFQFGRSAGVAGPQVAETTRQILLLATNATTANPALGDAGDATDRLFTSLARGGRALVDFGISLTPAQIEAQALAENVGKTSEELSLYDRAAAGATLATQQLGDSLGGNIARNAEQPAIALRRLREEFGNALEVFGAPLLEPLIDAFQSGQPILLEFGQTFGDLARTVLPLAATALDAAAPALQGVGDAVSAALDVIRPLLGLIEAIPDPILKGVATFVVLNTTVKLVTSSLAFMGPAFASALGPVGLAVVAVGTAVAVFSSLRNDAPATAAAVEDLTAAFADQAETIRDDVEALVAKRLADKNQEDDLRRLGLSVREFARLSEDGASGFLSFVDSLEAGGEISGALATQLRATGGDMEEVRVTLINAKISGDDLRNSNLGLVESFADLSESTQAAAQATLTRLVNEERLTEAQVRQAVANTRNADGTKNYVAALEQLAPAQEEAAAKLDGLSISMADLIPASATEDVGELEGALADLATALGEQEQAAQDAEDALNGLFDAQIGFLDSTIATETANRRFGESLADVTNKADELANAVRENGRNSDEARAAQENYTQAVRDVRDAALTAAEAELRLAEDRAAASGQTLTAEQRQDAFRSSLERAASQASGPSKAAIVDLIGTYNSLPREVTTKVDANTEPAKAKISALAALMKADLANFLVRVDALNPPSAPRRPGAMAGGTFGPGELLVGEGGREIVVVQPGTSATVIPNAQTEALLAGRGRAALDPELTAAIRALAAQPRFAVELGVIAAPGADPYPAAMETARQLQALSVRMSAQT